MKVSLDGYNKELDISLQGASEQEIISTERVQQLFREKVSRERKRTVGRRNRTLMAAAGIFAVLVLNWNSLQTLAAQVMSKIIWVHQDGTQVVNEINNLSISRPLEVDEEGVSGYTKYYESLDLLEEDLGISLLQSDLEWDRSFTGKVNLFYPKEPLNLILITDFAYAVGDLENIEVGNGASLTFTKSENSRFKGIVNLDIAILISTSDDRPGTLEESVEDYSNPELYTSHAGLEALLYCMNGTEGARLIYNNVKYQFSGGVTREIIKEIIDSLHE